MSKLMTVEEIKDALQDRLLTKVSASTGINRNTLSQIRAGKPTNMRQDTIQKLTEHFEGEK